MEQDDIRKFDFTEAAWESWYDAVDDVCFQRQDAKIIYNSLKHRLKIISFGDYLKRYIYLKAELKETFDEIPLKEYQSIIKEAFLENHTPPSFAPTTAKLSALSKNWLTQQTVKRNVVFLLGFGLRMSAEDVNMFLTKALLEPEINPKNPFEVICWYCYKKGFSYLKFEKLWETYNKLSVNNYAMEDAFEERTIGIRNDMHMIQNDEMLLKHVSRLKVGDNQSYISITAKECFDLLYDEARDIIAQLYNQSEDEQYTKAMYEYVQKLSENDRLYDSEKIKRIEQFCAKKKIFTRCDISESDIEDVICAAIPKDRYGNLKPSKASRLSKHFLGKRFSRQRIGNILSGEAEVTRFDLITLNFFIFSQKLNVYPDAKVRYIQFYESTNKILDRCFLGKIYVQNPYECFVLMCILAEDPLATYADVWELSYHL